MLDGLQKLARRVPIKSGHDVQNAESSSPELRGIADGLASVLLPLGVHLVAAGVSRFTGKSGNVRADRIRKVVSPASIALTGELIRLLPLIPSPFVSGKLAVAQRLMRRHQFVVPLLVTGHRVLRNWRR